MTRWPAVGMLGVVGLYMAADGLRALLRGDYLTPSSGPRAGSLGPWASLLGRVGLDPRAAGTKAAYTAIGVFHVAGSIVFAVATGPGAAWLAFAAAVSGLWYVPFGTIADLAVIASLVLGAHLA